ncbi:hypothetical protein [Ammoniphilus sp. YIM 78166]|uniref:hypothetical protein n=1 Tax=Ammoniphilus sp. YIM 78166 TaxID=1644106 RepID=UPI00106FD50B|nr:hypothetical protein [Ammoniphilus sp. YIM 78166]
MKKIASIFSVFVLSAAMTACGTAGVNNLDSPGYDRHVYDVNYNDVDDVYEGGGNRTIYTNRAGTITNNRGHHGYGNPLIVHDRDNYLGLDERDVDQRTRTLAR